MTEHKDATEILTTNIDAAMVELRNKQELFLLNFFGSIEAAEEFGHLYIVEEYAPEVNVEEKDGVTTYALHSQMRIRPKTPEELGNE